MEWYDYHSNPSLLRVAKGKFDYGTDNDGLLMLPNKFTYRLVSYRERNEANGIYSDYNGEETIYIATGINENFAMGNPTLTTGKGFVDIFCMDVDDYNGEEIIKVNDNYSNDGGLLDFHVYTSNLYNGIAKKYTRTFHIPGTYGRSTFKPTPKTFYTGDFNGDGKVDLMMLNGGSSLYIFDLEKNKIIYKTSLDFYISQVYPTTGSQTITADEAAKRTDRLIPLDYNGDGKTDFCIINDDGIMTYTFKTDDRQQITSYTSLGKSNAITKQMLRERDLLVGEFNGDGKTDFMLAPIINGGSSWLEVLSKGNGQWDYRNINITTKTNDSHFYAQDLNEDGQTDIVETYAGGSRLGIYYMSDGLFKGNESHSITPNSILVPTNIQSQNYFSRLLTLSNNGIVSNISTGNDWAKSRLLTGVIGSYGTIRKIAYLRLNTSDYSFYTKGYGASFPYQDYNGGLLAVSNMVTYYNGKVYDDIYYRYEAAIFHRQGLGFRGFKKISAFNESTNENITQVFNPYHFSVLIKDETTKQKNDYEYKTEIAANKLSKSQLISKISYDKSNGQTIKTTYTYDNFSNPLTETVDYGNGIKETTTRIYKNNNPRYVLGLPLEETKTSTREGFSSNVKVTISYNDRCLPVSKSNYYNNNHIVTNTFLYDSNSNIIQSQSKSYSSSTWLIEKFTYDTYGRVIRKTLPIGTYEDYTYYTTDGLLKNTRNQKGNTSTFVYNPWGNKIKTLYADNTIETSYSEWSSSNNESLYKCVTNYPNAPAKEICYDAFNRIVEEGTQRFDGIFLSVFRSYDSRGRIEKESLPGRNSFIWKNFTYDDFDRIIRITGAGKDNSYSYNKLSVTSVEDSVQITKNYDALGLLVSTSDLGGTTTYEYRPDKQIQSVTTGNNIKTTLTYDIYGRKISMNDPSAGVWKYEYDNTGNLAKIITPNGKSIQYLYDTYNRIIKKIVDNEQTLSFTYNSDGQLLSETSNKGFKKEIAYDQYQRLFTETGYYENRWFQRSYSYLNGNVESVKYKTQDGFISKESYKYLRGNMTEILLNDSASVWKLLSENNSGSPCTIRNGKVITQNHFYNNANYPMVYDINSPSFRLNQFTGFQDSTGNLVTRRDIKRNLSKIFKYDKLDRLVSFGNETVTYDNKGNITKKSDVGEYEYESSHPYAVSVISPNGNVIPVRKQEITYNTMLLPSSIMENGYEAVFNYDGDGQRIKMSLKKDSVTSLIRYYFSNQYEVDVKDGKTIQRLYLGGDASNAPAVYVSDGNDWKLYYIGRDYLGSIVAILDTDGNLKQELSYDAWGRLRNPDTHKVYELGEEPDLFLGRGYLSQEYLPEFGLINLNTRLYDPVIGRFISPDPYIQTKGGTQGFNRYSYGMNNPFKYKDPNGKFIIPLLTAVFWGAVIGSATSAIIYSVATLVTGQSWSWGNFAKSVGMGAVGGALGGALGYAGTSMGFLKSFGNTFGYNILSQISNTMATNVIFGNNTDFNNILGMTAGSLVGSFLPSFKGGIKGQIFKNAAMETSYNTVRGAVTGLASGIVNAIAHKDIDFVWQGITGGAISGASRSILMNLAFGSPFGRNITYSGDPDKPEIKVPALLREGGILGKPLHLAGITLGRNADVFKYSSNTLSDYENYYRHESIHVLQQQELGWASFYGRYFSEFLWGAITGNNIYITPGTLDYDAESPTTDFPFGHRNQHIIIF